MYDLSNLSDVNSVSLALASIAKSFHKALTMGCNVELRVEDSPHMNMDSILSTKITEVQIDEKLKFLSIKALGLELNFNYETFDKGTSSNMHDKFYFKSENATLTVVVRY